MLIKQNKPKARKSKENVSHTPQLLLLDFIQKQPEGYETDSYRFVKLGFEDGEHYDIVPAKISKLKRNSKNNFHK